MGLSKLEQSADYVRIRTHRPPFITQLEVIELNIHKIPYVPSVAGRSLGLHHVDHDGVVREDIMLNTLQIYIIVQKYIM